jgi:lipoprotein-releasing system ATP-binding protein
MGKANILEIEELEREFPSIPEPLKVLRGIDLILPEGEAMAIMGPSGSGKSTLLQIMGTLDRPTAGRVRIGGEDPFAIAPSALARFRNRRIGFVFQDHHLLPQCSVLENILIPTLVTPAAERPDAARGMELLERVGLADRADHLPSEISGGERQRTAVARALVNRPALLLCDEPTGNLDEDTAGKVGDLFEQLLEDLTTSMVVVTHSPSFAARFGTQYAMSGGKLVPAKGRPTG